MKTAFFFAALALCACSRPDPPVASTVAVPRSAAPAPVPGNPVCERAPGPRPAGVPSDWAPWTCWSGCDFWLSSGRDQMPAPIQWTACNPAAATPGCRQMTTPWTVAPPAIAPDVFFSGEDSGQGHGRLLVQRLTLGGPGGLSEWVVGDVDGELDFAMRAPRAEETRRCFALNRDFASGRFALSLHGDGSPGGRHVDGLLVGTVGVTAPQLAHRDDAIGTSAWSIGGRQAVQNDYGHVSALSTDLGVRTSIYEPARSALRTPFDGRARIIGDEVVFQLADYRAASIWAYDAREGARPLIDFGLDDTRGASNVGTDGHDLVWTQGQNKPPGVPGAYADVSIFTAPYTVDRARLAPRRLRREMNPGIGTSLLQFAVGCGHAGRPLFDGRGVEIVRLKDGAAFVLTGGEGWSWERVLGFSCREAFLAVRVHRTLYTVARVKLDALGPPLPAD